MNAKNVKNKQTLVHFPLSDLQWEDLSQGVLLFGDGTIFDKFKEIYGNKLYHWSRDQKICEVSELPGHTLLVTSFFEHSYKEDVLRLFEIRRSLGIHMIVCVPAVPMVDFPAHNPIYTSDQISDFLRSLSANSQETLFSFCDKRLASFLAPIFEIDAFRFENIMFTHFAKLHYWKIGEGDVREIL